MMNVSRRGQRQSAAAVRKGHGTGMRAVQNNAQIVLSRQCGYRGQKDTRLRNVDGIERRLRWSAAASRLASIFVSDEYQVRCRCFVGGP